MKRPLFALSLVLSLCAPSLAALPQRRNAPQAQGTRTQTRPAPKQTRGAAAPAPAPAAQPLPPSPLVNRVLSNGLEIIVVEDHSVPLVTVELAVKNGSYTEPPELNGLSHLYEHMFFQANRAVANREDYIMNIDSLGITYGGQTHEELVNYYFTTTTPNLPVAMRLLRDNARYPLFHEGQFERERAVVIGELDRHESNPYGFLGEEMTKRLFYKYPSRKSPGGNRETVMKATTEMMRLIQGRYYVPNNSAIILTGDITPEAAFKLVEGLFGDWPRREKNPFDEFPPVEHPPLAKSEGAVIRQPVNNVILNVGWHGPSIGKDDAATYAADVFSFILRQPDSRFQRALVDSGLATGVDISYYTQRNVGPIRAFAVTTPEKARAAVRALHAEIARFNDPDYFTDEQLESAKALLEADELYSREKLSDYAHTVSFWWASTGVDYYRDYHKNLRRVSRADINRYVTNYIHGKPRVGLALMSDEAARVAQLTEQDLIGQ